MLFLEYGHAYRALVRGDLALLYFTDDPLISPHFFRRNRGGWQMDLVAEVRDTRNFSGGPWTWGLLEQDDDFTRAFFDRYIVIGPILRPAGADNRPLPIHAAEVPRWASQPGASDPPGVEQLTVTEAAERIAGVHGRPTVVLLYSTWNEATQKAFPAIVAFLRRCQAEGVEVLAFSTDENWNAVNQLAGFLRANDAPFRAIHLYRWPPGQLTRAMAPLGVRIERSWLPPLVAVRDGDGRVVAQEEGLVSRGAELDLTGVETAVRELAGRPPRPGMEAGSPSR